VLKSEPTDLRAYLLDHGTLVVWDSRKESRPAQHHHSVPQFRRQRVAHVVAFTHG
jgi:hypothetical protein